jgi:CBS domain-containing protein
MYPKAIIADVIKYLSELLGKPVTDPDGAKIGRVRDAAARQGGRLPLLAGLLVADGGRETWVPVSDVLIGADHISLKRPLRELTAMEPGDNDVWLRRDVLDKQIVDVHDYRVVRANDVRLAECAEGSCVVGVDASLRALLRRLGIAGPIERVASMAGKPMHSRLIAWDDVETLEPSGAGGGRIKLKVPHEKIARLHPADIADIVEQLDPQQRTEIIEALDVETAADTIEEMEDKEAAEVIEQLEDERAADILEEMEPDDAADVLGDLPEVRSEELLGHMEPEEAADVKELLAYAEETAGGLMTTEFVSVRADMTCQETIEHLRRLAPKAETVYYVYVVDDDERLVGVLSLRDLIVADPTAKVSDVMVRSVRHVSAHDHADEIAHVFNRYNLLALPVVDEDARLVGIVTVDDMMEHVLPPERRRKLPELSVEDE